MSSPGLTEKQKGSRNAPEYQYFHRDVGRLYAGRRDIRGDVPDLPRGNASTDFNVVRNYRYAIATTIKGINENDVV